MNEITFEDRAKIMLISLYDTSENVFLWLKVYYYYLKEESVCSLYGNAVNML